MQSDDWLENRIRWKAAKHGLPADHTFAFPDLQETHRDDFTRVAEQRGVGKPVLAFLDFGSRWTLLGTRRIVSSYDETLIEVELSEVREVGRRDRDLSKHELEFLRLETKTSDSPIVVWAPRGREFFALWSILSMLCRIYASES
jgi:hypothetical protein